MSDALDNKAKAEVAAIVESTVGKRLDDLVTKFDDLSAQAGAWRTNLETAVTAEFEKLKTEVAATGSAGGHTWSTPDRGLTVLSPECWVAYPLYPTLIQTPSDAAFVLQAAVTHLVECGCGQDSAAVSAVKMAFDPVMTLVLDPVARSLASSTQVYRHFVDTATYHANTASVNLRFAKYAKQRHALHGSEWAEAQEAALKSYKALGDKGNKN